MPSVAHALTKPSNSAFKQQRLRACQPILTPYPVIITFLVIGLIFVPVGVVFFHASNQIRELVVRYDASCANQSICTVDFPREINMKAPVYVYYRLENFYQNHRRYVKSRNDAQLRGDAVTTKSSLTDCAPYVSLNNSNDPSQFYFPCGLIARTFFNDTFQIRETNGTGQYLPLRKKGIAWPTDVKYKFKNPSTSVPGIRTIPDMEDEDFIVWMRTAGLPTFSKLWRIIDYDIKGHFSVDIYNNYPVEKFNGGKYLVLSEIGWMGGKNAFLGIAYMTVGAICLVLSIIFLFKHRFAGRSLGDDSLLGWKR